MRARKSNRWSRSVVVEIAFEEETAQLIIDNTREAAECLMELWPDHDGPKFSRALLICACALDGVSDDVNARAAFLAAAEEAGIVVPIH